MTIKNRLFFSLLLCMAGCAEPIVPASFEKGSLEYIIEESSINTFREPIPKGLTDAEVWSMLVSYIENEEGFLLTERSNQSDNRYMISHWKTDVLSENTQKVIEKYSMRVTLSIEMDKGTYYVCGKIEVKNDEKIGTDMFMRDKMRNAVKIKMTQLVNRQR